MKPYPKGEAINPYIEDAICDLLADDDSLKFLFIRLIDKDVDRDEIVNAVFNSRILIRNMDKITENLDILGLRHPHYTGE